MAGFGGIKTGTLISTGTAGGCAVFDTAGDFGSALRVVDGAGGAVMGAGSFATARDIGGKDTGGNDSTGAVLPFIVGAALTEEADGGSAGAGESAANSSTSRLNAD